MEQRTPKGFEVLDWFEPGITAQVALVRYVGDQVPEGLGNWVSQPSHLEATYPSQPARWVQEPASGNQVVLKISRPSGQAQGQLSAERWTLLTLLTLKDRFADGDTARPCHLLGYGVFGNIPYLALEYVSAEDRFISFEQHLKQRGQLTELQALRCVARLCEVLAICHTAGIVHNDINDLKLEQVFWDMAGRRLRLIDFANAVNMNAPLSALGGTSYGDDRRGVGRLLYTLITGQPYPLGHLDFRPILSQGGSRYSEPIIEKCLFLRAESYRPTIPGDTQVLLKDIGNAISPLEDSLVTERRTVRDAIAAGNQSALQEAINAVHKLDPDDPAIDCSSGLMKARERLLIVKQRLDDISVNFVRGGISGFGDTVRAARDALNAAWQLREPAAAFGPAGIGWLFEELTSSYPLSVDPEQGKKWLDMLEKSTEYLASEGIATWTEASKAKVPQWRADILQGKWSSVYPDLYHLLSSHDRGAESLRTFARSLVECERKVDVDWELSEMNEHYRQRLQQGSVEEIQRLVQQISGIARRQDAREALRQDAAGPWSILTRARDEYHHLQEFLRGVSSSVESRPGTVSPIQAQIERARDLADRAADDWYHGRYKGVEKSLRDIELEDPNLAPVLRRCRKAAETAFATWMELKNLADGIKSNLERRAQSPAEDPGFERWLADAKEQRRILTKIDPDGPWNQGLGRWLEAIDSEWVVLQRAAPQGFSLREPGRVPLGATSSPPRPGIWHEVGPGWALLTVLEAVLRGDWDVDRVPKTSQRLSEFVRLWRSCADSVLPSHLTTPSSGDFNALVASRAELPGKLQPLLWGLGLALSVAIAKGGCWEEASEIVSQGVPKIAADVPVPESAAGVPSEVVRRRNILEGAFPSMASAIRSWLELDVGNARQHLEKALRDLSESPDDDRELASTVRRVRDRIDEADKRLAEAVRLAEQWRTLPEAWPKVKAELTHLLSSMNQAPSVPRGGTSPLSQWITHADNWYLSKVRGSYRESLTWYRKSMSYWESMRLQTPDSSVMAKLENALNLQPTKWTAEPQKNRWPKIYMFGWALLMTFAIFVALHLSNLVLYLLKLAFPPPKWPFGDSSPVHALAIVVTCVLVVGGVVWLLEYVFGRIARKDKLPWPLPWREQRVGIGSLFVGVVVMYLILGYFGLLGVAQPLAFWRDASTNQGETASTSTATPTPTATTTPTPVLQVAGLEGPRVEGCSNGEKLKNSVHPVLVVAAGKGRCEVRYLVPSGSKDVTWKVTFANMSQASNARVGLLFIREGAEPGYVFRAGENVQLRLNEERDGELTRKGSTIPWSADNASMLWTLQFSSDRSSFSPECQKEVSANHCLRLDIANGKDVVITYSWADLADIKELGFFVEGSPGQGGVAVVGVSFTGKPTGSP